MNEIDRKVLKKLLRGSNDIIYGYVSSAAFEAAQPFRAPGASSLVEADNEHTMIDFLTFDPNVSTKLFAHYNENPMQKYALVRLDD